MKILFVSLGCDKNLVDSEHMSGLLSKAGYEFTDDETQADIIIINSCCFIKDAKEESIETIFEMARYKEEGQCKALVLAGCLAQRYHEEIKTEIPEVDICIGTTAIDSIVSALDDYFKEHKKKEYLKDVDSLRPLMHHVIFQLWAVMHILRLQKVATNIVLTVLFQRYVEIIEA